MQNSVLCEAKTHDYLEVVSSNGFMFLNKISYKMVTRTTEMERISLEDHFKTDKITHRFSLTTLDNDIADNGDFILVIKNFASSNRG
jgi:hypothetical protein